jgi:monofunctional biosynthetic peptidoglycan transglycosylase
MKKILRKISGFLLKLLLFIVIISIAWVTLYKYLNPPITPLMLIRFFEEESGQRLIKTDWKNYDDISNYMKLAVIASEDQKFPFHNGFDIQSIEDAIDEKLDGERLRGASTISQQTAKNVFLWPSRSWIRKGMEAYFTVLIEKIWGKRRILEVYLNVIETGNGIYGVDEAGEVYFGRSAKNLDIVDSALIAAILPDPRVMSPKNPSEYILKKEKWIIEQIGNLGGTSFLKNIK